LEWSLLDGNIAVGARLAGSLLMFWLDHGDHVEGHSWTQEFLKRREEIPAIYRPKFLYCAGYLLIHLDDLEGATKLLSEAVEAAREFGNREATAFALSFLGLAQLEDVGAAMANLEESLALFRELHHKPGLAMGLTIVGEVARFSGDDDLARRMYEES